MKITLEPTELDQSPQNVHPKVTIETCYDDMTMGEVIDSLLIPALLSWGFDKEAVDAHFAEF